MNLNGSNLFLYEARLSAKQLVSSHNERFTQSLRDIESPYEESEDEDAPLKTKEVCEKKVEKKTPKEDVGTNLSPVIGGLNGNKFKAKFFYKVDPARGSIDAITKIPNVPLVGKYEDKRHFVVEDKSYLTISKLKTIEIGVPFALDTVNDWTGRVSQRNDEAGFLVLAIQNASGKVKLDLTIPYENEVVKFVSGKFKINRGIVKLDLDFKQ